MIVISENDKPVGAAWIEATETDLITHQVTFREGNMHILTTDERPVGVGWFFDEEAADSEELLTNDRGEMVSPATFRNRLGAMLHHLTPDGWQANTEQFVEQRFPDADAARWGKVMRVVGPAAETVTLLAVTDLAWRGFDRVTNRTTHQDTVNRIAGTTMQASVELGERWTSAKIRVAEMIERVGDTVRNVIHRQQSVPAAPEV